MISNFFYVVVRFFFLNEAFFLSSHLPKFTPKKGWEIDIIYRPAPLKKTISQPQSWEKPGKIRDPPPPLGMVSQLLPGFEFGSLPLVSVAISSQFCRMHTL